MLRKGYITEWGDREKIKLKNVSTNLLIINILQMAPVKEEVAESNAAPVDTKLEVKAPQDAPGAPEPSKEPSKPA